MTHSGARVALLGLLLHLLPGQAPVAVPKDCIVFSTNTRGSVLITTGGALLNHQLLLPDPLGYWGWYGLSVDSDGFVWDVFRHNGTGLPIPPFQFYEPGKFGLTAPIGAGGGGGQFSLNAPYRESWGVSSAHMGECDVLRDLLIVSDQAGGWWFLDRRVPNAGLVRVALPVAPGPTQSCSDGRWLYACVPSNPTLVQPYADVYRHDVRTTGAPMVHVARVVTTGGFRGFGLGPDGLLFLSASQRVFELDALSGVVVRSLPHGGVSAPVTFRVFGYDEWSASYYAIGGMLPGGTQIWRGSRSLVGITWAPIYSSGPIAWVYPYDRPGAAALANERAFERLGRGCPNGLRRESVLRWSGVPRQGGAFRLEVVDAEPQGLCCIWMGASDVHWAGVGSLPMAGAPYGAPGCDIMASVDWPNWGIVDHRGAAGLSVTVPINPALHGIELFAQSATTSSSNSLGLSVSGGLLVRFR